MARSQRQKSCTGIYHVMLRGVNKQIIFEESGDYRFFIRQLSQSVAPTDELGRPLPPRCSIFAYCLMPNHVHLIVQEKHECLSEIVRRIATAYAAFFNRKYERVGHLFQDRFKSEPVNDFTYFVTLLRYVHQNPVAGGLCMQVKDYVWSSWGEYSAAGTQRGQALLCPVCDVSAVLGKIPIEELQELVNEPLTKTAQILDFDKRRGSITNDEIVGYLTDNYGLKHPFDLQLYCKERRNDILHACKELGASIRQLSRLTGFSERIVRNA